MLECVCDHHTVHYYMRKSERYKISDRSSHLWGATNASTKYRRCHADGSARTRLFACVLIFGDFFSSQPCCSTRSSKEDEEDEEVEEEERRRPLIWLLYCTGLYRCIRCTGTTVLNPGTVQYSSATVITWFTKSIKVILYS